jgi:hypothetical protein
MSKKNKVVKPNEAIYGISRLSHTFDVGYLIEEGVELIKDSVLNGELSLEDALYGLLVSAKADQWLEDKYPTIHANQTHVDCNRVTFTDLEEFEHLKH